MVVVVVVNVYGHDLLRLSRDYLVTAASHLASVLGFAG